MSSRDRLCRIAARFLKRRSRAAWEKPRMPRSGRSSSAGSRPGSSGKFHALELVNNTRPLRWYAWSARLLAGCRKAIGATTAIPCWSRRSVRIATEDRHPELNASQRQAVDEIFLSREKISRLRWHRRRGQDDNSVRHPRRRGGRGLQSGRLRANIPRGAEARRSRHGDIHATEASGAWTAA